MSEKDFPLSHLLPPKGVRKASEFHVCRICETEDDLLDIFTEKHKHIYDKLQAIATFKEEDTTNTFKYVCYDCKDRVEELHEFKRKCEVTYEKLWKDLLADNTTTKVGKSTPRDFDIEDVFVKTEYPVDTIYCDDNDDDDSEDGFDENCMDYLQVKVEDRAPEEKSEEKEEEEEEEEKDENDEEEEKRPRRRLRKRESIDKSYQCSECDESFQNHYYLTKHKATHLDSKDTMCSICNHEFSTKQNLKRHIEDIHEKVEKVREDKAYQCNQCPLTFKNHYYLTKHQGIHTTVKKNVCPICGQEYSTKQNLRRHIEDIHEKVKKAKGKDSYSCNQCDMTFKNHYFLTKHRAVHLVSKKNVCTHCNQVYSTKQNLRRHIEDIHEKLRNHLCTICGKGFAQITTLKSHYNVHSKIKFQCDICGKRFKTEMYLKLHKLRHIPPEERTDKIKKRLKKLHFNIEMSVCLMEPHETPTSELLHTEDTSEFCISLLLIAVPPLMSPQSSTIFE
uniref:Putative zn finger n=1 Tax=Lutzomyia longipalpis TaxID=7200 RepID=A0A1B0CGC8_LUTLO